MEPERLVDWFEAREQKIRGELESVARFLEEEYRREKRPRVRVFFGANGIRSVFLDELETLDPGDEVLIFHAINAKEVMGWFIDYYHKRRIKKGIGMRMTLDRKTAGVKCFRRVAKMPATEARVTPEDYSTPVSYHVYGNKVAIMSYVPGEILAILIEGTGIARGFRENFELVWRKLRPLK